MSSDENQQGRARTAAKNHTHAEPTFVEFLKEKTKNQIGLSIVFDEANSGNFCIRVRRFDLVSKRTFECYRQLSDLEMLHFSDAMWMQGLENMLTAVEDARRYAKRTPSI